MEIVFKTNSQKYAAKFRAPSKEIITNFAGERRERICGRRRTRNVDIVTPLSNWYTRTLARIASNTFYLSRRFRVLGIPLAQC